MTLKHAPVEKRNHAGQSLVEMAIIAPILLIMFIGVIEVGWALRNYLVLQNSTREATRFAARGRYLDFSKTDVDEIGYPYVVQHEMDSIAGQIPLSVAPGTANSTIIVSHVLVDTGPCGGGTNDDLVLSPVTPGYGHFSATFGQSRASRVDFGALAAEMIAENEAFNCDLADRNTGAIPSVNSVVVVESYFPHQLLVNVPIVSNLIADANGVIWMYTRTSMRISADARGQIASAGQGCESYPIALHTSTLDGHQAGDSLGAVLNGTSPGNFGWLRWNNSTGHNNVAYLVEEFQNPRLAVNTFIEAGDVSDTTLNAGDWVWGLPATGDDSGLRTELQKLVDNRTTIRVPVWNSSAGSGLNQSYHVQRFVKVQVTAFTLSPSNRISLVFVGEDPDACPDVPAGGVPTATATLNPGANTPTATGTATDTPTATNTPTPTDTPTPTPTNTPIAPTGCNDFLPPDGGATWTSLDIGGAIQGFTGSSGGSIYLCGAGSDIGGSADAFRYAYRVVNTSNVEFIARLASWNGSVNGWSKGGLMIRTASAPSSANEAGLLTGSNGLHKQWRASDGASTSDVSGGAIGAPVWFRLLKVGSIIATYRSADGSSWTLVGSADTVSLGATYLVGMAVSSHDNSQRAYATFDSISVNTAPAAVTIASDGFESGNTSGGTGWSGNWTLTGEAAVSNTGGPRTGTYHLRLRSNTGVAARTVNTAGVVNPRLQFYWKADSFESGEYATTEVYDGTWHTVLTVSDGQDDTTYHAADIDLSGYTMSSTFQVRFKSYMSGTGDYFYVDDLAITGYR
jgi:hypothetical protein